MSAPACCDRHAKTAVRMQANFKCIERLRPGRSESLLVHEETLSGQRNVTSPRFVVNCTNFIEVYQISILELSDATVTRVCARPGPMKCTGALKRTLIETPRNFRCTGLA